MMDAIQSLLKDLSEIDRELSKLKEMETDARARLAGLAESDVTSPSAKQTAADSRLALELVGVRRAKLQAPSSELQARLRREFRLEGDRWNARVEAARLAVEKDLVAALLPFFDHKEACLRRTLGAALHSPRIFERYREALFHFPSYQFSADQDLARDVRGLVSHIHRHEKLLGIP